MAKQYPGAHWMPIEHNFSDEQIEHLGLVLHVQAGNGSLFGWFNNPNAEVSAHFWAAKSGRVEQYVDADLKAWAEAAGNSTYVSVESEGVPEELLNHNQIEEIAQLYAWGHKEFGWPLQLANEPGEHGLGWHGMGGEEWGGHFGCPGDKRKAQREDILKRSAEILGTEAPAPAPVETHPQPVAPKNDDLPSWYHRLLEYPPSRLKNPGETATDNEGNHYQVGEDVQTVQRVLGVRPDGWYGPASESHVKGFQHAEGLSVDGIVGPDTARKLEEKREQHG